MNAIETLETLADRESGDFIAIATKHIELSPFSEAVVKGNNNVFSSLIVQVRALRAEFMTGQNDPEADPKLQGVIFGQMIKTRMEHDWLAAVAAGMYPTDKAKSTWDKYQQNFTRWAEKGCDFNEKLDSAGKLRNWEKQHGELEKAANEALAQANETPAMKALREATAAAAAEATADGEAPAVTSVLDEIPEGLTRDRLVSVIEAIGLLCSHDGGAKTAGRLLGKFEEQIINVVDMDYGNRIGDAVKQAANTDRKSKAKAAA